MKFLPPRFLALFLPISAALGVAVFLLYRQDMDKQRLLQESQGSYGVNLHAEIIAGEFGAVQSDLLFLSEQNDLTDFLARPDAARKRSLAKGYLLFCARKGLYDQIRYLDETGLEVMRVNYNDGRPEIVPDSRLQPKADRYYFREAMALSRGNIYVSPFDLNVERGAIERPLKPTIRFATPVFDARGRKRGVVVLNYLGSRLFHKLSMTSANLPGSLMLLNGDGYWLNGPREEDAWGFMFGNDRTFGKDFPEIWREIVRGGRETLTTGQGLFAFRTLAPGAKGLTIVYHVSENNLYLKSRKLLSVLLAFCAFIEILLAGLIWLLCRAEAVRENNRRRLLESEARLRALSKGLIDSQESERKRISRDLHDDLGQLLTVACLELESALQPNGKADRQDVLRRALDSVRNALERMREISSRLRPWILDDMGLKEAVRSLLEEYRKKTGIDVQSELSFERRDLPAAVSENIYRILQEALTNAAKHARTKKGLVILRVSADKVELTVKDWGVGMGRPAGGDSMGLLSMRERAGLLGGTFQLSSEPDKGTEVRVVIPMPAEREAGES